jgi:hypothetical protein
VTEIALEIMRIIIELPWLNENSKSLANIVNQNVVSPTITLCNTRLASSHCTGSGEKVKNL